MICYFLKTRKLQYALNNCCNVSLITSFITTLSIDCNIYSQRELRSTLLLLILIKYQWYITIVHRSQNKYTKNDEYFLSVYIKKRRSSWATLSILDVCNREKRQVVWYSYLSNDALRQLVYFYVKKIRILDKNKCCFI